MKVNTRDSVTLSVVVPAFNEELTLEPFYAALVPHLESLGCSWEIVFVNDGSRDATAEILRSLNARDSRVKVIHFSRNFGNQIALTAGLAHAGGDAVVTMDADLQHPPEIISKMVRLWREDGYDSVYTIRTYDQTSGGFKRFASRLYQQTLNFLSDIDLPPGISDFRLLDRKVLNYLNGMDERSRFLRAQISWLGFRQIGVPYTTNPRFAGESKFSLSKLLRLSIDGITSFSTKPLRWISYSGMAVALLGLVYAAYVVFETLVSGVTTPGWPTLVIMVLILGGLQLISLGVIGEYVGKIYMETKRRPLYVLQEKLGFAENTKSIENVDRAKSKAA